MPSSQTALVITLFVVADLVVIPIIIRAIVMATWRPLQQSWPGRPLGPGAVIREFQSVRLGSSNFGGCVHIAVDEACLHLLPARFIRWFGAGPVSVEWEHVSNVSLSGLGGTGTADVGRHRITAPAWALELARPCGPRSGE